MTREEKLLAPIAELLRRRALETGIQVEGTLDSVLREIQGGNATALAEVIPAVIEAHNSSLYSPAFFAQESAIVAEHLCGSVMIYTALSRPIVGLVTKVAAFPEVPKDKKISSARPGTIGAYPGMGGNYTWMISAHGTDDKGTVVIWGINLYNQDLTAGKIRETFPFKDFEGQIIGSSTPFIVNPRDQRTDKVGSYSVIRSPEDEQRVKVAKSVYKLTL